LTGSLGFRRRLVSRPTAIEVLVGGWKLEVHSNRKLIKLTKSPNSSTSQLLNQHTRNTTNITPSGFIVHTCLFTIVMPSLRDYFPSLAAMPPAWDLAEKLAHDDNESTKLLNSSTPQLLNSSTPQPTLNLKL